MDGRYSMLGWDSHYEQTSGKAQKHTSEKKSGVCCIYVLTNRLFLVWVMELNLKNEREQVATSEFTLRVFVSISFLYVACKGPFGNEIQPVTPGIGWSSRHLIGQKALEIPVCWLSLPLKATDFGSSLEFGPKLRCRTDPKLLRREIVGRKQYTYLWSHGKIAIKMRDPEKFDTYI